WLTGAQISTILASPSTVKVSENPAGIAMYTPIDVVGNQQPGGTSAVPPADFIATWAFVGTTYPYTVSTPEPGAYCALASGLGLICFASNSAVRRLRRRHAVKS